MPSATSIELARPGEARRARGACVPRGAPDRAQPAAHDPRPEPSSTRVGGTFWIVVDGARRGRLRAGVAAGDAARCSAPMPDAAMPRCWPRRSPRRSPGVVGEAAAPRAFAGRFAERHGRAGRRRSTAQRLYELGTISSRSRPRPGALRLAERRRSRRCWSSGPSTFADELDTRPRDVGGRSSIVGIAREQSLGVGRRRAGVDGERVRTRPPAWRACNTCTRRPRARGAGYATACVEHLSRELTDRGLRCVLFTDLEQSDVERDLPSHRIRGRRRDARLRLRLTQTGGGGLTSVGGGH